MISRSAEPLTPYPTGRVSWDMFSRHFVPGYHSFSPYGTACSHANVQTEGPTPQSLHRGASMGRTGSKLRARRSAAKAAWANFCSPFRPSDQRINTPLPSGLALFVAISFRSSKTSFTARTIPLSTIETTVPVATQLKTSIMSPDAIRMQP